MKCVDHMVFIIISGPIYSFRALKAQGDGYTSLILPTVLFPVSSDLVIATAAAKAIWPRIEDPGDPIHILLPNSVYR